MSLEQQGNDGQAQHMIYPPQYDAPKGTGFFGSIFLLDAMLTPKIITLIYWLGSLICIAYGVAMIGGATDKSAALGFAVLFGGVIGMRLWCELWVVIFKIHQNLKKIADKA